MQMNTQTEMIEFTTEEFEEIKELMTYALQQLTMQGQNNSCTRRTFREAAEYWEPDLFKMVKKLDSLNLYHDS